MQQRKHVDQFEPSRQARLRAFLVERGVTQAELARRLRVGRSRVNKMITGWNGSEEFRRLLVGLNVPDELLPEARAARRPRRAEARDAEVRAA